MRRKLSLFLICAFEISLILFVAGWTAWANDANSFFKRYNSPEYGKYSMQCPDRDGSVIAFSVSNNIIQISGLDLGYAARNGNTNQYYLEGALSMFLDFDKRVFIQLINGQEVFSTSCR